jgi:hypothetical protein
MKNVTRPTNLVVVCFLLLLWGGLTFWKSAVLGRVSVGQSTHDFGVFALLAAPLLFALLPIGRLMALGLTYYWLVGGILWLIELFGPFRFVRVTTTGNTPDILPLTVARVVVIPFLLLMWWQLRVLRNPDIMDLFKVARKWLPKLPPGQTLSKAPPYHED